MAGPTRLELATSCVTGRRSNQLNYGPAAGCGLYLLAPSFQGQPAPEMILDWWAVSDLNGRPPGCKPDALTAELTAQTFQANKL